MASDTILLEYDGPVAVVTNNRPDKHNAANDEMDDGLREILEELSRSNGVRAIIWRANGKSWSSGRDVSQIGVRTEDIDNFSFIKRGQGAMGTLMALEAPIICALKGWVIGGSFERSLVCDLRIAAEDTRIRLPEVAMGLVPGAGGTVSIPRRIGRHRAAWLAVTGTEIDAATALRWGLVDRIA